MHRPLRVYLDSSDYSTLSDVAKSAREAPGVVEELLRLKRSGAVEFFFSAAHLTEMAPLQPNYASAAVQRAELLVELCEKNAMLHHQIVFEREIRFALGLSSRPMEPIDRDGGWFPEGIVEMLPLTAADHAKSIKETVSGLLPTASRAERRRVQKQFVKGSKPRAHVAQTIREGARQADLGEILAHFPMQPEAARILARYVSGDASAEEATVAFQSSLRDPRWMMRWFSEHHEKLTPFIAWARGPAANLAEHLLRLAEHIQAGRANPQIPRELIDSTYTPAKWAEMQSDMLTSLANRFAQTLGSSVRLSPAQIDAACPGMSTAVRALHSAWRSVTFDRQRKPKSSDFVDALHAVYAPYVDVFRADGFMADYIEPRVRQYGTSVVPKLPQLPALLAHRLAKTDGPSC